MRPGLTHLAALALALLIPAQGAFAQEEEALPPGFPPKLGEISGQMGKKAVAWEFFDFSVGAFDASAWVDRDWETKAVTFHLIGYRPGKSKDMRNRLLVTGGFGKAFHTGKAAEPVRVSLVKGRDLDGPQLIAGGDRAEVVIDSIGPAQENSYLRHVTGRVSAEICPQDWPSRSCEKISLRFETDVQMGSDVPVKR
jgi:hypothetical protein